MQGTRFVALLVLAALGTSLRADPPSAVRIEPPQVDPPARTGGNVPAQVEILPIQVVQPAASLSAPSPSPVQLGPSLILQSDAGPELGPRWQVLAGAGFSLLTPFQDNNRAFIATMRSAGGGRTFESTDFGSSLTVAPRFWLGVAGACGWGFRTSYWHFDQSETLASSVDGTAPAGTAITSASPMGVGVTTGTFLRAPGNADVLSAHNSLNLNVLDFELTREIGLGATFLLISSGARYARIGQHYDVDVYNTANDFSSNAETERLRSSQRFVGGGPTLALQGWYPLGRTRFSIYGTTRGTILFGDAHQAASANLGLAVRGRVSDILLASASANQFTTVPVGELEIGLQWTGLWGRFHPFVRTGVTAQTWFNALTASSVLAFGDTANLNTNLSFLGVSFLAGLNY